jgi:hypothetical protein
MLVSLRKACARGTAAAGSRPGRRRRTGGFRRRRGGRGGGPGRRRRLRRGRTAGGHQGCRRERQHDIHDWAHGLLGSGEERYQNNGRTAPEVTPRAAILLGSGARETLGPALAYPHSRHRRSGGKSHGGRSGQFNGRVGRAGSLRNHAWMRRSLAPSCCPMGSRPTSRKTTKAEWPRSSRAPSVFGSMSQKTACLRR